jgi:WD40 repeat protein
MTEVQPAGREEVEVAHEALLRRWPGRRRWLEPDGGARQYPRLEHLRRTPTGRRSRVRAAWLRQPAAIVPPSLTVVDPNTDIAPIDGQDEVEVAHEALIRHWPRLRAWLDQDRAALLLRESVREAAQEWEQHGRDESYLAHRGRRLEEATTLSHHPRFTLNAQEQAYLDAAVALREREEQEREAQRQRELTAQRERAELAEAARREAEQRVAEQAVAAGRLRRRFLVAAGLGALAVLAAIYAFYNFQEAGLQRAAADAQRLVAEERGAVAVAAAGTAEAERGRADAQAATAEAERTLAVAAAATAAAERARAERQALIATSRQLSAQALSQADERYDLALLLAVQANHVLDDANVRGGLVQIMQSNPRLRAFLHGHKGAVTSAAFSPDGTTLVTGGEDGNLNFWDPLTLEPKGDPVAAHDDHVRCLVFSSDGKTLASGGGDGFVHLWAVAGRRQLPEPFSDRHNAVMSLAFSPDDRLLAVGSQDFSDSAYVWDLHAGQRLEPAIPTEVPVVSVAFSPDGTLLALGDVRGRVVLWDLAAARPAGEPLQTHASYAFETSVVFSPNGKTLAVGSWHFPSVVLWDVSSRRQLGDPLIGHTQPVASIAFSPDGSTLATGAGDGKVVLWSTTTRQPLGQPLTGVTAGVGNVAFSPDGRLLASTAGDSALLWDLMAGPRLAKPLVAAGPGDATLTSSALSPDGTTEAVGDADGMVRLWDVATRQPGGDPVQVHTSAVSSMAFADDGATLATFGLPDGDLRRWNPLGARSPGDPQHVLSIAPGDDEAFAVFSPDGAMLAIANCAGDFSAKGGCRKTQITVVDAATGQLLGPPLLSPTEKLTRIAFSPDGALLAASNASMGGHEGANLVVLWRLGADPASFDLIQPGTGFPPNSLENNTTAMVFSPDGKVLAAGISQGTVVLWDIAAGGPIGAPFAAHRVGDSVRGLAFSADGGTLAAGSQDGFIRLWDVATGQPIGPPLTGHSEAVVSLAFSPDGETLISRSWDESILIWDISLETLSERACRLVGRNLSGEEWRQFIGPEAPYERTCPDLPSGEEAATPAATWASSPLRSRAARAIGPITRW